MVDRITQHILFRYQWKKRHFDIKEVNTRPHTKLKHKLTHNYTCMHENKLTRICTVKIKPQKFQLIANKTVGITSKNPDVF